LNKIYWSLLLAGVSIILALVVAIKIPAWNQTIGGYVVAIFIVGAFILVAFAGYEIDKKRKVKEGEHTLVNMKSKNSIHNKELRRKRHV